MSEINTFTLYVYDGDYGLPSMNTECIQFILYLAMCNVPMQIKVLNNIKHCSLYSVPCLIHNNLSFKTFSEKVSYLKRLGYNLDANLTIKDRSEALAITKLVQSNLKVALEYVFWMDLINYDGFTRVWFAKALPILFNFIHIKRLKEIAVNLIESSYPDDYSTEKLTENIIVTVTESLEFLSSRLGNSKCFYGDQPCTVDVLVYSYLAPFLKVPFPSNRISSLVSSSPNLVRFIQRIDQAYFSKLPKGPKYFKHPQILREDEGTSYLAIFIISISTISILSYAIRQGLMTPKLY